MTGEEEQFGRHHAVYQAEVLASSSRRRQEEAEMSIRSPQGELELPLIMLFK